MDSAHNYWTLTGARTCTHPITCFSCQINKLPANTCHPTSCKDGRGQTDQRQPSTQTAFDAYNDKLCRVNDLFSSLIRQSKNTTSYYHNKWNVVRLTELLWENSLFICWDQFCMTIISCSGNPLVHNHSTRNTAEDGHTMCSE